MDTLAAMRARRTAHRWQPTPVDDAVVERCLEAAHQAPCHKHTWPWRFTLVGPRARARVTALAIELKTGGRPVHDKQRAFLVSQFGNPGALVVVSQVVAEDAERAREDYAACACAIENMMLAARAWGVSSLFTTFFFLRREAIKEILGIPPQIFMECAVFFGYGAEELGRPRRKPVREVTHLNGWGTPYELTAPTGE